MNRIQQLFGRKEKIFFRSILQPDIRRLILLVIIENYTVRESIW